VKRSLAAVLVVYVAVFVFMTIVRADVRPTPQQIAFATESADLMQATIFGALLQEFAETTPFNVEQGKHSISLVFDDRNESMRLVGELQPLRDNDVPQDDFEGAALERALQGEGLSAVEKVEGNWVYRRSVPLSNFHVACSLCHTNFGPVNSTQWVGALMLQVPVVK
jgi:hypothetical protein